MKELRESTKKRAEVFRIIGLSAMGSIGLDLLDITQTLSNIYKIEVIINLLVHIGFVVIGRSFLSQSFQILEEEENHNEYE